MCKLWTLPACLHAKLLRLGLCPSRVPFACGGLWDLRISGKSQRDCVLQPRVARATLDRPNGRSANPNGVSATNDDPFGIHIGAPNVRKARNRFAAGWRIGHTSDYQDFLSRNYATETNPHPDLLPFSGRGELLAGKVSGQGEGRCRLHSYG